MARQFTLGKNERLKSRKAIERLFREGQKFSIAPFRVFYFQTGARENKEKKEFPVLQFGIGVSSRNFKKAVDRNRVKRLAREAWRLQKAGLQQQLEEKKTGLHVFLIYTAAELPDYPLICDKVLVILNKLRKLVNENTAPHT